MHRLAGSTLTDDRRRARHARIQRNDRALPRLCAELRQQVEQRPQAHALPVQRQAPREGLRPQDRPHVRPRVGPPALPQRPHRQPRAVAVHMIGPPCLRRKGHRRPYRHSGRFLPLEQRQLLRAVHPGEGHIPLAVQGEGRFHAALLRHIHAEVRGGQAVRAGRNRLCHLRRQGRNRQAVHLRSLHRQAAGPGQYIVAKGIRGRVRQQRQPLGKRRGARRHKVLPQALAHQPCRRVRRSVPGPAQRDRTLRGRAQPGHFPLDFVQLRPCRRGEPAHRLPFPQPVRQATGRFLLPPGGHGQQAAGLLRPGEGRSLVHIADSLQPGDGAVPGKGLPLPQPCPLGMGGVPVLRLRKAQRAQQRILRPAGGIGILPHRQARQLL